MAEYQIRQYTWRPNPDGPAKQRPPARPVEADEIVLIMPTYDAALEAARQSIAKQRTQVTWAEEGDTRQRIHIRTRIVIRRAGDDKDTMLYSATVSGVVIASPG